MSRRPAPTTDTIVAVATGPTAGAIGVVRLTGRDAVPCASHLLRLKRGTSLETLGARLMAVAELRNPGTGVILDEVFVVVMRGPHSYTGEDVVEISCHGNPMLLAEVVRMASSCGARMADPGEFTRRAYLNGRIDLLQAEAVLALIGARTLRSIELAARQMVSGGSGEVLALREEILNLLAGLEVSIDFPEDGEGMSRFESAQRVEACASRLRSFAEKARRGRSLSEGVTATIAGAPNVGKSSLLNALLGRDRAIVSPQPGTTRDIVEGQLILGGVSVVLGDGAGLGDPQDAVDAEGMRRTWDAIQASQLLLVAFDLSRPISRSESELLARTENRERLLIGNKSDLKRACDMPVDCACSALTGEGIDELLGLIEKRVRELALSGSEEEGLVLTSVRTIEHLEWSRLSLEAAGSGLRERAPIEVIAIDLRRALEAVDSAVGIDVDEDILDRIFEGFCVGK